MRRLGLICSLILAVSGAEANVQRASAQTISSAFPHHGAVNVVGIRGDGADQIANVNVNGVLNVRAFGASGSTRTMTCNVTASRPLLTGCSGGDFKVGQTIRILSTGISPTIPAPAAPKVACASSHGGSCVGTVTYGYKVAAIQNAPNGPITAASRARSVTQSAQVPSTTWLPNISTTVSTSPLTNANYYAWYKSINGGPYNFYTITPGNETTFADTGDLAQGFTCTQLGVPCSAPSVVTPNDVFAQIVAIKGATFTIARDPLPPRYWAGQALGLPAATFPGIPAITAKGVTVEHDDTPAFQAIVRHLRELPKPGFATVFIPPGDYNVYPSDPSGHGRVFDVTGMNYVTIEGVGRASRFHDFGDRSNGQSSSFILSQQSGGWGVGDPVADPVPYGARKVRLLNPANAAHFFVGGYVVVFINASTYPGSDYQELNRVTSVDGATGVVGLGYPLNKPYSSRLPLPYSRCKTCVGSPRIAALPHGPAATHIVIRDFWFEGPAYFFNANTMDWVTTENLWVHDDEFDSNGVERHRIIRNNIVTDEGNTTEGPSLGEGAAGSGDILVEGNTYEIHGAPGIQACQEQTANVSWIKNRIVQVGTGAGNALLGGGDCYGWLIANNDISISNSNSAYVFGGFTPMVAKITGNVITIDSSRSIGMTYNGDPTNTDMWNNKWTIGSGIPAGPQVAGTNTLAPYSSLELPMPPNGSVQLYANMGYATVFKIAMTRSVATVNLGSIRHPGLVFAIDFIQDHRGRWTLPPQTGQSQWTTRGNDVDFIGGTAPIANPSPNSSTIIWFFDDGVTVHEISTNYQQAEPTTFNGTAGSALCAERLSPPLKIGSCYLKGYRQIGAPQTYTYPVPFNTTPVLLESGGGCGPYKPTATATALTLPANRTMMAESCNVVVLGQ